MKKTRPKNIDEVSDKLKVITEYVETGEGEGISIFEDKIVKENIDKKVLLVD